MPTFELLAPAGDMEKLNSALDYGADAVYLGGESFGLRKASKNFSMEDLKMAVQRTHDRGKKVYITLNIIPHDRDMVGLEDYVLQLQKIGTDAVIVADLGVLSVVRRVAPTLAVHISTQASVTNTETVKFYYDMGVRRIVLARELSLEEIRTMRKCLPDDMEIECFVHGAMCISYSGRCLLSNYMTGRDANLGDCAQACRYNYRLVEEKRPGEFFPVFEDEGGTFIMNSKDLCMIEYIRELAEAGITSFKIEGRVKSSYYVATVIRSYRMALDAYLKDPINYSYNPSWLEEIKKVSHRDFTTGFYFEQPKGEAQVYGTSSYIRGYDFVGVVLDYDEKTGIAKIEQRNRLYVGDTVEFFGPNEPHFEQLIREMKNETGEDIDVAPRAQETLYIPTDAPVKRGYFIRKRLDGESA